ncbi:MAG: rRNA maturation RNase YbeY [Parvicellaceae bacterium]
MPIYFHKEDASIALKKIKVIKRWLEDVVSFYNKEMGVINVVFCSDDFLLKINKEYLNHNYLTDIITFNFCEKNEISGDLFISIDRVKDFSKTNKLTFVNELHRVIVHGVLHLCGFNDKSTKEKQKMRKLENFFLEKLKTLNTLKIK